MQEEDGEPSQTICRRFCNYATVKPQISQPFWNLTAQLHRGCRRLKSQADSRQLCLAIWQPLCRLLPSITYADRMNDARIS